ncbi:uroporphyrinogen-III synthase [Acinetobacter sp. MD2]|uniref:uroporphyrinogen-III synthase n=1 Tax=Acinetobacter sp. MD2 TaxID=2600066 RepID=UPI002D1F0F38|nr:uroporphyrinogen-III synthase [Acinetobacter sp. MD2]MEB3766807.1 uroporphyrinogen-III synthase [Acinetobacter sp. MD2]
MLFINTRPAERAHVLSNYVRDLGIHVLDLPLLELRPIDYSPILAQLYQQLVFSQVVVVVSPTAAEIGWAYLAKSGLTLAQVSHLTWIAVGAATAKFLAQKGIQAVVPTLENSEGMLSLPILQQLNMQRVAFWRGEGGRQFMMDALQQRGIEILNFILYRRYLPENAPVIFKQQHDFFMHCMPKIYVCISSEASWRNWQQLCHNSRQLLCQCHYIVLGERLYHLIANAVEWQKEGQIVALAKLTPENVGQYLLAQEGLA